MEPDDPVIHSMLVEAQQKASALVDRLREQQAEIDANPPDLPPEQLAAGRAAMQKAIESAERTLAALRAAALSSQSRNN